MDPLINFKPKEVNEVTQKEDLKILVLDSPVPIFGQAFLGNNTLICSIGESFRLFAGSKFTGPLFSFFLYNSVASVFNAIVIKNKGFLIYSIILQILLNYFMLKASFTDPGIIP